MCLWEICEICTRPSTPGSNSTNAPKFTRRFTTPVTTSPMLISPTAESQGLWSSSFDAQADFSFFRINLQYFNTYFITFRYYIRRFLYVTPSDFRYVYKTVNSAHINKCAELSQTLYCTFDDLKPSDSSAIIFQLVSFEFFFKNFFSRQDYFAVLTVKFFHFNAQGTTL